MIEQAIDKPARRRRVWSDAGLALSVVLAIPLAMIVEWLAAMMVANSATWRDLAVLSVFAIPLVTAWLAIALSLAPRPVAIRLAVAAWLLLAPPLALIGIWNG